MTQQQPLPEGVRPPSAYVSLQSEKTLHVLARILDAVATERSVAVHEVRAAEARLLAQRYDRFPQVRPTGSVDLNGDNDASLGLSLRQVIWDGGRSRVRLSDAELGVAEAGLRAWAERNEDVYEGLSAFVKISRFQARLRAYADLKDELESLEALLEIRASGGVADRGEGLRISLALQELQRDIIADTSMLRQARSDMMRLLPRDINVDTLHDLSGATGSCIRTWPGSETPLDALARIRVDRTRLTEELTRAQRFPSLILGAGAAVTNVASATAPGIILELDASDMLGLEGARAVEATVLDTQTAIARYEVQREDTGAELERLEANYSEAITGLRHLRSLQRSNREAVELYSEQIGAGSIPLTEGVSLYREIADTDVDIIDFQSDILINCLRSSHLRGILAPFTNSDNSDD